jgi:26S proteasome regulatory subunit N5
LLKQLVTMEVIQWTALWEFSKHEFENEKNLLGGALGAKAAEDLKLRIIEHVLLTLCMAYSCSYFALWLSTKSDFSLCLEYLGCV